MPAIRGSKSSKKTRRHKRDLDQIHLDLRDPRYLAQHKETKHVEDLPGLGKYYCVECAKWCESEDNLLKHTKGKPHKRRVRQLKEEPYTQREAELAAGFAAPDNGTERIAMDIDEEPAGDAAAALVLSPNAGNLQPIAGAGDAQRPSTSATTTLEMIL